MLEWLLDQSLIRPSSDLFHDSDELQIKSFTVYQAFLMGYYYGVFLPLVDTSSLEVQSIDGAWGFLSTDLIFFMHIQFRSNFHRGASGNPATERGGVSGYEGPGVIGRQDMLAVLSRLFLSYPITIPSLGSNTWCLGVVRKRALFIKSLVSSCNTPKEVAKYVLLDVDVGGIPTDSEGLVRPGIAETPDLNLVTEPVGKAVRLQGLSEDFTKHVEPDWDGNPETSLLCIRYKGRRLTTLNPTSADALFCAAYTEPVPTPQSQDVEKAVEYRLQDMLDGKPIPISTDRTIPIIVQAQGRPCMRYTFAGLYGASGGEGEVRVVSNCIHAALKSLDKYDAKRPVVIA